MILTKDILAGVAHKVSVSVAWSITYGLAFASSLVEKVNVPVGEPVEGIYTWSTVNWINDDWFPWYRVKKGSWIMTVFARVSHQAPGFNPTTLVKEHVAGGLSRTTKLFGIRILIWLVWGMLWIGLIVYVNLHALLIVVEFELTEMLPNKPAEAM